MKQIDTTGTFFTPENAIKTAADRNADVYDDFVYIAKHDPKGTGYSLVHVINEDGEFVAKL